MNLAFSSYLFSQSNELESILQGDCNASPTGRLGKRPRIFPKHDPRV